MISLLRRRRPCSRGQALVEFAFVFPIFLLVLFGLNDVGRYVYVTNALNEASREGARFGSVEQWQYSCPASVGSPDRFSCTQAVTLGRMSGVPAGVFVNVTCFYVGTQNGVPRLFQVASAAQCGPNDLLTVEATTKDPNTSLSTFRFLTPGIGSLLGTPTVSGMTQMSIQ